MGRFDWLELPDLNNKNKAEENAKAKDYPGRYDPEYCLQAAYKQFKEGDFLNALRDYSRALHSDVNNLPAWIGQVKSLLKMNELTEAKVWCEKAQSLFPESEDLTAAKALLLSQSGLREYALRFSDASLKGAGASFYPWLVRGEILLREGQIEPAGLCFGKAQELEKDTAMINFGIGEAYFNNKRFSQAVEYFMKSLEEQPANFFRWFMLVKAYVLPV